MLGLLLPRPEDDEHIGIIYEPAHVSETNDYHGMGFLLIPPQRDSASTRKIRA